MKAKQQIRTLCHITLKISDFHELMNSDKSYCDEKEDRKYKYKKIVSLFPFNRKGKIIKKKLNKYKSH